MNPNRGEADTTMMRTLTRRFGGPCLAVLAGLLLFLAAPSAVQAQEGTTSGSIVGQVLNPDGTPAANARVIVTHLDRGASKEVLTNEQGRFVAPLLQPGRYRVRAESPPQPAVELPPMRVSVGQRQSVTIQLRPVEVEELDVEVGRGELAEAEAGAVDLVSEEQVSTLPTPGRDFTDFINLSGLVSGQPGITTGGQFSIGGARTSLTNLQIDGSDANNAFFGENRGSSRVPFTFSLESIKEFQIITSGYDVEYGRFAGGVVNAVTKSGTNEVEGSAHFFWRDESFTSSNFDDTEPADFQAFQFGGTLSGPIVEDELHYFLSGDFQQWDQPAFALDPERSNVPASTIDEFKSILIDEYGFSQDFIDDQFGTFTETEDEENLFGRLDWTASDKHRLTLRANYLNFTNRNDRLLEDGTEARTSGSSFLDESISIVGEWNAVFSDRLYNTLRVQYANEERPRPGNSQLPDIWVSGVETEDGGTTTLRFGGESFGITFLNRLEEEKIQVTDNLTFNAGDHTLKIGTNNIFTNTFNRFWLFGNGWFPFFGGMEDFRNKEPTFFLRAVPDLDNPGEPPSTSFDTQEWAVYAQDEWRASDKLRLTLGVRWDYTNWVDAGEPLADSDLRSAVNGFGVTPTEVPSDKDNFGPRVAFNYDVQGDESSVLRGGAGIFYARTPTVNHSNITLANPRPLKFVFCLFPSAEGYRNWDSPENIPISSDELDAAFCSPGNPELSVWDQDFEDARTYKANLAYEHQLGNRWRATVEGIFSRTTDLFGAVNLNQPESPFFTTQSGRPVWVPEQENFPTEVDLATATRDDDIRALYEQVGNGEARAFNFKVDVKGNPTDDLRLAANYTLNLAYDNNTTECCTSNALLFDTPTAGNPNFLGNPGDEDPGAWGPSKTERRHVFVTNFIWDLPADLTVSAIYRAQAGNPFTPSVQGDLNGDGGGENDRPFLPDPDNPQASGYTFEEPNDLQSYRQLLQEHSCLREAVGSIIQRNTCRNPWWHSVDLKLKKQFTTLGDQSFEVIADFFNVLDGLGIDAGEFVFQQDQLFQVESYDPDTEQFTVSTGDFGREIPVGFKPLQFQAQLGVRYSF